MYTISVCVITKNEEHNIVDCLSSASFADEIIIIDSESTDSTVALCKQFTDKISIIPWTGCGPQRAQIYAKATSDWVLLLDADERITPELATEIKAVLKNPKFCAYNIPFKSYYCGKQIRFGDWMHEKHIRLLKRDQCKIIPRLVHFGLEINGKVGALKGHILHYSFPNLHTVISKMHAYSTAGAEHYFLQNKRISFINAISHGLFTFIRGYFLRFGFLDGRHGFMLAFSNAEGSYYKYAKLIELQLDSASQVSVRNSHQQQSA